MSAERKRGMRYAFRTANEPKWKTHSSAVMWVHLISGEMSRDPHIFTAIFGSEENDTRLDNAYIKSFY